MIVKYSITLGFILKITSEQLNSVGGALDEFDLISTSSSIKYKMPACFKRFLEYSILFKGFPSRVLNKLEYVRTLNCSLAKSIIKPLIFFYHLYANYYS